MENFVQLSSLVKSGNPWSLVQRQGFNVAAGDKYHARVRNNDSTIVLK